MWVHGYLHLIGYDHKKLNDFKKMYKKEKLILKYFHKLKKDIQKIIDVLDK